MVNEPRRAMDGYEAGDMAIPTWNLLQNTGGTWAKTLGGQPGQFHNTGSDEIAAELNIIVVDILMGRARWGDDLTDAGPLCASLDAKSNLSLNGDDCSQCPSRLDTPWSIDATERRTRCCLTYTILGIDINDHMPCLIRGHGISALPIRQLISQLRLNRQLKGEYYRAVVNIKSQEKTGKAGTAYALHPKIVELITDETRAGELKAESNQLLGTPIPLPEGRPEEEVVAYTPEGEPIYSEEEKTKAVAQEAAAPVAEPPPASAVAPPAKEPKEPAPPEKKEEKKEPTEKKPLDLDF